MLAFQVSIAVKIKQEWLKGDPIIKRNWTKYIKDSLLAKLSNEDWTCNRSGVQPYFNWMESKIIDIIDSLAPIEVSHKHERLFWGF